MNCEFKPLGADHRQAVIDILNFYIEDGFAAFPREKVSYEFFDILLKMTAGYPAIIVTDKDRADEVVGFALMRPYHLMKTFQRTAQAGYFLRPEYTRRGIGRKIMEFFTAEAGKMGVDSLLADISSLNEASIKFHRKMGFELCGRFRRVGRKHDRDFDVVWMQKMLRERGNP